MLNLLNHATRTPTHHSAFATGVCARYDTPMPKDPYTEIIARGLLTHNGRVLLCKNIKNGYCYLPGGHVEFAEPARDALAREMVEECGQSVVVGPLLLSCEIAFKRKKRVQHEISLVFHMEQLGGTPTPPDEVVSIEDHIGFVWADLGQLHEIDLRPNELKAWLMSGGGLDPTEGPFVSGVSA